MYLVMLAVALGAAQSETEVSFIRDDTAAVVVAAKANRGRTKTVPTLIERESERNEDPEEMRLQALGYHGIVTISGILASDGKFTPYTWVARTRSPELNAFYLRESEHVRFNPALDQDGKPIAIWMNYERGGLATYIIRGKCDIFFATSNWWLKVYPNKTINDFPPFQMVNGMRLSGEIVRKIVYPTDLKTTWNAAMDYCRGNPKKMVPNLFN